MEDEYKDYKEMRDEALKMKEALDLPSIDTALLMMIQMDTDQLRYNNSD